MTSLRRRGVPARAIALVLAGGASLPGRLARAQSASDEAAAEALFKQGRELMAGGQVADACPKFVESQRLDPAPGTLLNLATCYEKGGLIASAWVTYKEAATAARQADQIDRARMARDKAAELEPKLPTLTIVVPSSAEQPGLVVRRDGQTVGRPEWGVPIPVDPGPHLVDAAAPGYLAWQGPAQNAVVGSRGSVEVPRLERAPEAATVGPSTAPGALEKMEPAPSPFPTATAPEGRRAWLTAAWVVGGLGVAGLATGGVLGVIAIESNASASDHHCIGAVCDAQGVSLTSDARGFATGSTIAFAAGGALAAAGLVLFLAAPRDAASRHAGSRSLAPTIEVLPVMRAGGALATIGGRF